MKVLIVGLGSIAQKHIAALRQIEEGVDIYALRSSRNSRHIDLVEDVYDWGEAEAIQPDFVLISNPTSLHAEVLERAIGIGCPLFIEKPLFQSLSSVTTLERIIKSGLPTYVACNLRFLGCLRYLKCQLDDEQSGLRSRINEVNIYCGSYLPDWRPATDYKKCYSAIPELGGGVHLDLIHELDYAYWLFGMPDMVRATMKSQSSLGIKAVDYANYLLGYSNFCANVVLNYYRRDYKRTMEIVFDEDTWEVDLSSNSIKDSRGNVIFSDETTIAMTYRLQMEYFIRQVVNNGCKSFNDVTDAFNVLKIALQ